MNENEQAIASLLKKYEQALNESSTEAVMKLYAPDGVFMPQHFPTSVGEASVRKAYDAVFQAIALKVQFTITELYQIADDWAFARTTSAGTTTAHANGQTGAEANQELFVFQHIAGEWKIARYCFCTTNPPR